jgi:GT2 family glycosyltransferase
MVTAKSCIISILSWDTPEYIENLLNSLQLHRPSSKSFSIIILDQGSGKETQTILEKYKNKQVEIIYNHQNIGFSKGHNTIFEYAKSKYDFNYFCCVNSDVKLEEDFWLDKLIRPFEKNENVGISGPMPLRLDWWGVGHEVTEKDTLEEKYDIISGCLFLTSKSNIEKLGLFDEVFTPAYHEDADLNMRYKKAGLKLIYVPVKFKHNYLDGVKKTANKKREDLMNIYGNFYYRNAKIFINRWVKKGLLRKGMSNKWTGYYKYVQFNFFDIQRNLILALKKTVKKVIFS